MIEPVFVGLLVAAFAFLFPRMSSHLEKWDAENWREWKSTLKVSEWREGKVDVDKDAVKKSMRGFGHVNRLRFASMFMLDLYVIGIAQSGFGYLFGVEFFIDGGIATIIIAFFISGVIWCWLFWMDYTWRKEWIDSILAELG